MEKATLSVRDLSEKLGISLPKAYELVKQPGFPVLKIGSRVLIPVDAFPESASDTGVWSSSCSCATRVTFGLVRLVRTNANRGSCLSSGTISE